MDLEAFRSDRRHLGLWRALVRAAYYRASRFVSVFAYPIVVLTLETANRELLGRETDYAIRPLTGEELEVFSRDPSNRISGELVAAAKAKQDVCLGVLDGAELASFGWYSARPTGVGDWGTFHCAPRYVYMFHGYTKPAYRGQNLHGLGLVRAARLFDERGYEGVLSLTDWANYASLSSCYRSGFQDCGVVVRLGRGERSRFWVSPGCRRYGVRFESGAVRLYTGAQ